MGLRYDIDTSTSHVRIVGTGKLSMPEMIAAADQVAGDPRFVPGFAAILDIREGSYTAEMYDGQAFVAAIKRRRQDFPKRFALLVPQSLHVLGTLFCLLAKTSGIDTMNCFTDIGGASEWCGVGRQREGSG